MKLNDDWLRARRAADLANGFAIANGAKLEREFFTTLAEEDDDGDREFARYLGDRMEAEAMARMQPRGR